MALAWDQDKQPRQFWKYFIAAFGNVIEDDFSGWFKWTEQPSSDDLDDLIQRIYLGSNDDFVLVLDDYHRITTETIHEALTYLLDYLPLQMHLVISGRSQPPFPTAQMRVRNQLLELTRADLEFSQEEGRLPIKNMTGQEISEHVIAELHAKTEGWVAGLQMAALSIKTSRHADVDGFIRDFSGSHHFVMDYLAEQAFDKQVESIREYLLSTSILDEMCGSLCDSINAIPMVIQHWNG